MIRFLQVLIPRSVLATTSATFVFLLISRLWFLWSFYTANQSIYQFEPETDRALDFLTLMRFDLLEVLLAHAFFLLVYLILEKPFPRPWRFLGASIRWGAVGLLAMIIVSHHYLLSRFSVVLTWHLFLRYVNQLSLTEIVFFGDLSSLLLLSLLVLFGVAIARLPERPLRRVFLGLSLPLVAFVLLYPQRRPAYQKFFEFPPLAYQIIERIEKPAEFNQAHHRLSEAQFTQRAWLPPLVESPPIAAPLSLPPLPQSFNLIIIVIESLSQRDFEENASRFPFLSGLQKKGVVFKNHYSSGNSSLRGLFGLFTGCYPEATGGFSSRDNIRFPSWHSHFGSPTFAVTPLSGNFCYPRSLLLHDGIKLKTKKEIAADPAFPDLNPSACNEHLAAREFLNQCTQSQQPFVGLYTTFIPHAPYDNYEGTAPSSSARERYLALLPVLDRLLSQLFQGLEAAGLCEKTLFLITADHGQCFGARGFFTHGNNNFEETVSVPAFLWNPRWNSPQEIKTRTHHTDLLPTLLDLAKINYDPSGFQGESLLRPLSRKYIFICGEQETSSIDRKGMKRTYHHIGGIKTIVSLNDDPLEKNVETVAVADTGFLDLFAFILEQEKILIQTSQSQQARSNSPRF